MTRVPVHSINLQTTILSHPIIVNTHAGPHYLTDSSPENDSRPRCFLSCVESFFGTLKRELVYHRRYATREEATQDIFEYIEVFYNRQRCHSTLSYRSPAEYEAKAAVA
jgi:hypothetical protein